MSLAVKLLRNIGLKLIHLSDNLCCYPVYRADSETGYACGSTMIDNVISRLSNDDAFRISKIYVCDTERQELMCDKALLAARTMGIPIVQTKSIVPKNYVRGRGFSLSAEFQKWEDTLLSGNHVILDHPENNGTIGAIARTSLSFGIRDIAVIDEIDWDLFDPHLIRASMGARFKVRIQVFKSMEEYLACFPENKLCVPAYEDGEDRDDAAAAYRPWSLVIGRKNNSLLDECSKNARRICLGRCSRDIFPDVWITAAIAIRKLGQL